MQWLHQIGRKDSNRCQCDPGVIQNAVHIRQCRLVADGKGRTLEQVEDDPDFCSQVYQFLQAQLD